MNRDTYVKTISRKLRLDPGTRKRVIEGIQTEIQLLLDKGSSFNAAQDIIGPPDKVAEDYNSAYASDPEYHRRFRLYMASKTIAFILVAAVILNGVYWIGRYLLFHGRNISQVGGADGPANVIIKVKELPLASIFSSWWKTAAVVLGILIICQLGWLLIEKIKKRRSE